MHTPRPARVAFAVLALAVAACASPVGVARAPAEDVYATLTDHALNSGGISDDTRVTLQRANLQDEFERDPRSAVRRLHGLAVAGDFRERVAALSELCWVAGERTGDRSWYLASAVYAHAFLFAKGSDAVPGKFRRRTRRAADFYNAGLALAFADGAGSDMPLFQPTSGVVELPAGRIRIEAPDLPLRFGGFAYDELRPAALMKIRGFRARDVASGLGATLVATRRTAEGARERRAHLAPSSAMAVTALLDIEGGVADMTADGITGRLTFHVPTGPRRVQLAGEEVPVEFDTTAALAWELSESRSWEKEISGFLDKDAAEVDNEIFLTAPYQRGKVPILFVHGTASSPARWAEVLNELHADGRINANCQFWIYQYGSGAPILVSARGLRFKIERVVRDVDPEGTDEALRQMVVVGHSQGGLLTRLQATSSGDRFWRYMSDAPIEDLSLTDSERRYLTPIFFFEPSPYVKRCVFLATPHRGSYVAGNWIGRIGASLVSLPRAVTRGAVRLTKRAVGAGAEMRTENLSTAVDDMDPGSPFLLALDSAERAAGVPFHSIVAVDGSGGVTDPAILAEDGADGVVRYESAHIPGADSEVVVDVDHSCQSHPATVAEIRRILHAHLDALGR